jgi:hypothetical protein
VWDLLHCVGLTRSREGKRRGLLWCVVNCLLTFQLSRIYSLWHGCHGRLTLDPYHPGGRGEDFVFFCHDFEDRFSAAHEQRLCQGKYHATTRGAAALNHE